MINDPGERPSLRPLDAFRGLVASEPLLLLNSMCFHPRGGPWLVGGALRDILLGLEPACLDVLACSDVLAQAPSLAESLSCRWTLCNRGHRMIVFEADGNSLFTLTRLPGDTGLAEYCLSCDFTVNSMALEIPSLYREGGPILVDSRSGLEDLERGLLRPCSWDGLFRRPERLLRAIRFECTRRLSVVPVVFSQLRAGSISGPGPGDREFWDELVALSAIDDPAVERRFIQVGAAERLLGAKPPVAESLSAYRELVDASSWSGGRRESLLKELDDDFGVYVRLLLLCGFRSDNSGLFRSFAGKGAPDGLVETTGAIEDGAAFLLARGFPWTLQAADPDGLATSPSSVLLAAASALGECRAGLSAGPDPDEAVIAVRRSLGIYLFVR